MGQFSVKTYNPPGSLLSATQHLDRQTIADTKIRQAALFPPLQLHALLQNEGGEF